MKNYILLLLFPTILFAQKTILVDEKIKGKIEIDGHTFENKEIKVKASIEGIKIYDKEKEYTYKKCNVEKCDITHLEGKKVYNGYLISTTKLLNN